jgi:hypothetical protein
MIEALTLEDLEYVAENPEDAKSMVSWFAQGGWTTASDEELRRSFREIQDNG